jgi:hypothetical protein
MPASGESDPLLKCHCGPCKPQRRNDDDIESLVTKKDPVAKGIGLKQNPCASITAVLLILVIIVATSIVGVGIPKNRIYFVIVVTAWGVTRLGALKSLYELHVSRNGISTLDWSMAYIGDVLVGITSPGLVYLICQQPSPHMWGFALTWTWFSIYTLLAHLVINEEHPSPPHGTYQGKARIPLIDTSQKWSMVVAVNAILNICSLGLLCTRGVREDYFGALDFQNASFQRRRQLI